MIKPPNFETLLNHVLLLEILIEKNHTDHVVLRFKQSI